MSEPFLAQVSIFSFNFAPKGWAMCNGQLLPINQNQALFSLLGTTYGGNGQTTFALPDLRDRIPFHFGAGHNLGEVGGEAAHTLTISEMATHTHLLTASGDAGVQTSPVGNTWAAVSGPLYNSAPNTAMRPNLVGNVGGSQPHANDSPFLVLNMCIALQGIFQSRN